MDLQATQQLWAVVKFKSGEKLDYSGYNRDSWRPRDRELHMAEISSIMNTQTNTEMLKLEKQFGVRYSELLRRILMW